MFVKGDAMMLNLSRRAFVFFLPKIKHSNLSVGKRNHESQINERRDETFRRARRKMFRPGSNEALLDLVQVFFSVVNKFYKVQKNLTIMIFKRSKSKEIENVCFCLSSRKDDKSKLIRNL